MNWKTKPLFLVSIVIGIYLSFLIILPHVMAYEVLYAGSSSGPDNIIKPPSFYDIYGCSADIKLYSYSQSLSFPYQITSLIRNPNITIIDGPSTMTLNSNVTKVFLSSTIANVPQNWYYEPSSTASNTSFLTHNFMYVNYSCNGDSKNIINITQNGNTNDSWSQSPNAKKTAYAYGDDSVGCGANEAAWQTASIYDITNRKIKSIHSGQWSSDLDDVKPDSYMSQTIGAGTPYAWSHWTYVPFDSGWGSKANITLRIPNFAISGAAPGIANQFYYVGLYDPVMNTTTTLTTGSNFYSATDYPLAKKRQYYAIMGLCVTGTTGAGGYVISNVIDTWLQYMITVNGYEPSWICGSYSACDPKTGIKTSVCTDPSGTFSNYTQPQTCAIGIAENATLGFEEYIEDTAQYCPYDPNWLALGCKAVVTPQNKTRLIPLGWNFSESLHWDYATMSTEWRKEREYALKMWYIPPGWGEDPVSTILCGNSTIGVNPLIERFNATNGILEKNVTFPASNMGIYWWRKACIKVPVKSPLINKIYGVWPVYLNFTCPEICNGDCKSQIITGKYRVAIKDADSDYKIVEKIEIATTQEERRFMDLTNSGLVPNRNYTIQISLQGDTGQSEPNCILIDDLNYVVLTEPLSKSCNEGCDSEGTYRHGYYSNQSYICEEAENSPRCFDEQTKIDSYASCESFCDGLTRYDSTDKCTQSNPDWILTYNAPICQTELDNKNQDNVTIENPTLTTDEYINILFSVPMLISFAILGVCLFVPFMIKEGWPLTLFGIAQIVFVASINGVISLYFALAEIVLAGLIFAYFVSRVGK